MSRLETNFGTFVGKLRKPKFGQKVVTFVIKVENNEEGLAKFNKYVVDFIFDPEVLNEITNLATNFFGVNYTVPEINANDGITLNIQNDLSFWSREFNLFKLFSQRIFPYINSSDTKWEATVTDNIKENYAVVIHRNAELEFFNDMELEDIKSLADKFNSNFNVKFTNKMFKYLLRVLVNPAYCAIVNYITDYKKFITNADDEELFKYAMYYAQYALMVREHMSKLVYADSYFLNLNIVCNFPCYDGIAKNPYIVFPQNAGFGNTLPFYIKGKRQINNFGIYQQRLKALSGIDYIVNLNRPRVAITGSINVPCAQVSPLENNFPTFEEFANFYYPGLRSKDGFDELIAKLSENEENVFNDYRITKMFNKDDEEPIFDSEEDKETNDKVIEFTEGLSDIDILVSANQKRFIDICKEIRKDIENELGEPVFVFIKKTRVILISKSMPRHIELFRNTATPYAVIKSFHVPAVRMMYTEQQVIMTRSCMSALMTGVCEDYLWVSSTKNPYHVYIKYIWRGFTIMFNENERKCMLDYNNSLPADDPYKVHFQFGMVSHNNDFFVTNDKILRHGLKTVELPMPNNMQFMFQEPTYIYSFGNMLTHVGENIKIPELRYFD